MSAGKCADAYGLLEGHGVEVADAEQAYILAELGGNTPTWVELPRNRWPVSWSHMKRPVCRLRLALYGHPDSGGHWERRCERYLQAAGFEPVREWRSVFWHKKLKTLLVVYVDDFKMAGPTKSLPEAWRLLREGIKTEDPAPLSKYLGCEHRFVELHIEEGRNPLEALSASPPVSGGPSHPSKRLPTSTVRVIYLVYDMSGFLQQCVERYLELSNRTRASLRRVNTPFALRG